MSPEKLATGMGIPDKALVTEALLPTGNLGQQPRAGTDDPGAATKGLSKLCTKDEGFTLMAEMGNSLVGFAAAKLDALARVESPFENWARSPNSAATMVGAPARIGATFKLWA